MGGDKCVAFEVTVGHLGRPFSRAADMEFSREVWTGEAKFSLKLQLPASLYLYETRKAFLFMILRV